MESTVDRLENGVAVVRLKGRFNMLAAGPFRALVDGIVRSGDTRIAVDLAEVTFLDSSGLGALIGAMKTARQADGDLRIARPNDQTRLVLQLTNMERVLPAYDDPETAFTDA